MTHLANQAPIKHGCFLTGACSNEHSTLPEPENFSSNSTLSIRSIKMNSEIVQFLNILVFFSRLCKGQVNKVKKNLKYNLSKNLPSFSKLIFKLVACKWR